MPPPSEEGSTDASIPPAIINTSTHGGGLASGLMDSGGSRSPAVLNVTDVLLLAWSYVHANAQKSPRRTAAGVGTVFIVVMFIGILYNAVLRSPVIFLRLAESQVGEIDMILTPFATRPLDPLLGIGDQPLSESGFKFFNATHVTEALAGEPTVAGSVPRWVLRGNISPEKDRANSLVTNIMICDLETEGKLGIGRAWPYRALGRGEAHVTASALAALGVRAQSGDRVSLDLGVGKLLATFGVSSAFLENTLLSSVLDDGIDVRLNGTVIREALLARGIFIPPNILPEDIDTTLPAGELLDIRGVIRATTEGLESGELLRLNLAVVDGIDYSYEKWPPLGNVVVLESKHVLAAAKDAANRIPLLQLLNFQALLNQTGGDLEAALLSEETPVADELFDRKITDYAFLMLVSYRDRLTAYAKDAKEELADVVAFSNAVAERLNFDTSLSIELPLHRVLGPLRFLRLFLDQIFNSVVIVLVTHGCLTIFALLLADASARTYEYGMLRVLGMGRWSLGAILLLQALYYALPGVALGLVAAGFASVPILDLISSFAELPSDSSFRPSAIFVTILVGLWMPLLGNLPPLRRVLFSTLSTSLDLYHKASAETTVTFRRLESLGLDPAVTAVMAGMVIAGGTVYYVIPMSFIFQDLDLLFATLTAILIATIAGFILLATLLQPLAERMVVRAIIWGPDRKFLDVVIKNLHAHAPRSRHTALIFTSSLAFIVFAGAMFSLQAEAIVANLKVALGSDLRVESQLGGLNETALSRVLNRDKARPRGERIVEDFAWASWPMWNVDPPIWTTRISNLVRFPRSYGAEVVSLTDNFLDVTYGDYFATRLTDGCSGKACLDNLMVPYKEAVRPSPAGFADGNAVLSGFHPPPWCDSQTGCAQSSFFSGLAFDAMVSASLYPAIGAAPGRPLLFTLVAQNKRGGYDQRREYLTLHLYPTALVSKCPGFFFSSYEATAAIGSPMVLISDTTYQRLFDLAVAAVKINATELGLPTSPTRRTLHVRLVDGTTAKQRAEIQNALRPVIGEQVTVTDSVYFVELTRDSVGLLMTFFYIVSAISALLCFFMLFTNTEANVRENLWEFGVLRALGINSRELVRVFVYEALGCILAAVVLGGAVGLMVACTLSAQQSLFTELPFRLTIPVGFFAATVVMSLVVAALGAYLPVRSILGRSISTVLKAT